jgi:CheY-like chemotaxis protein
MTRPLKIAVADDDRDTREYFRLYLSHLGHDFSADADGRQLDEIRRAFKPDLIVADYAMPRLDGLAAAAEVNRDRPVPVILIPGRHDAEHLARSLGGLVVRVLAKPVKEADLCAAIASLATGGLLEAGIANESEAERLSRGKSGEALARNAKRSMLSWPGEAVPVVAGPEVAMSG